MLTAESTSQTPLPANQVDPTAVTDFPLTHPPLRSLTEVARENQSNQVDPLVRLRAEYARDLQQAQQANRSAFAQLAESLDAYSAAVSELIA